MSLSEITKEDFIKYFKEHPATDLELKLLREHYLSPGRAASAGDLAIGVRYKSHGAVNLTYGLLAKKVIKFWLKENIFTEKQLIDILIAKDILWKDAEEINPKLSIFMKRFVHDKNWIFYMSDELAEVIEEMGWVKKISRSNARFEKIDPNDPDSFEEGGVTYRKIRQYERSTKARRICISKKGNCCAVCGLSFGDKYGKDFFDLIVVHHMHPLADQGKRETDPAKDLVPLCPNCHAMAHYGLPANKPRTIEELRNIVNEYGTK